MTGKSQSSSSGDRRQAVDALAAVVEDVLVAGGVPVDRSAGAVGEEAGAEKLVAHDFLRQVVNVRRPAPCTPSACARIAVEGVAIVEANVPRNWLRRSRRGLWFSVRDVPPERFRRVVTFAEQAGPSAPAA
jgi:hypothetical protein